MALLLRSLQSQPHSLPFLQGKRRTPLVQPLPTTSRTKRRHISICLASEGSKSFSDPIELPICQLPQVLFPGTTLPLQISEFRYRIMMQTVLQTDLRFGVLFSNPVPSATKNFPLQVGCIAEVVGHQRLTDDRFFIMCKGLERFRIARIQRTKPYMVSTVTPFEDEPLHPAVGGIVENLASNVEGLLKDVIRLAEQVEGKNQDNQNIDDVDFRKGQLPAPFSFFVASCFQGSPKEQQELLEIVRTANRLGRERDMMKATIKYLYAALAVKNAFSSS